MAGLRGLVCETRSKGTLGKVIAPPSLGNPHIAYQSQGRVTDPPQLIDQRPDVDGRLSSTHTPHGSALPSDCPWLLRPASPRQETGFDKL